MASAFAWNAPVTATNNLAPRTSPFPVEFQGNLYVFYNGAAKNNGIYYVTYNPVNSSWISPINVRDAVPSMNIAPETSPSCVVFAGGLYLFFNGLGNNGTFYVVFDGQKWGGAVTSVEALLRTGQTFMPGTSPSATVYNSAIHLFWTSTGNNSISCATFDGRSWSGLSDMKAPEGGLNISAKTSPCVVSQGDNLYLFYNGHGADGTWVAQLTPTGWLPIVRPQGLGFQAQSSPSAFCDANINGNLVLSWVHTSGAIWYCTQRQDRSWTPPSPFAPSFVIAPGTSVGIAVIEGVPHLFVATANGMLSQMSGLTLDFDKSSNIPQGLQLLVNGSPNFAVVTTNPAVLAAILGLGGGSYLPSTTPALPSSSPSTNLPVAISDGSTPPAITGVPTGAVIQTAPAELLAFLAFGGGDTNTTSAVADEADFFAFAKLASTLGYRPVMSISVQNGSQQQTTVSFHKIP